MENIENLRQLVKGIESGLREWDKCSENPQCDKKGFNFNGDTRFGACKEIPIKLTSWAGYSGSSSCSTVFSLPDVFSVFLVKYLNRHRDDIMNWILSAARIELSSQLDGEIAILQQQIDELKSLAGVPVKPS